MPESTLLVRVQRKWRTSLYFIPKLGKEAGGNNYLFAILSILRKAPQLYRVSLLPNLALPPAFSLRKEDTSPQTQTGTDGHFVMQMRAPAQRTKLQPRGKGAGPFPADKSKKGGALKMTLPLPHPQPARRRKSNRAQGLGSGCLPSNSEAHTSSKEPNRLLEGVYPW